MSEPKVIRPNKGGQEHFVRTNVDVAIYGGIVAGGKLTPLNTKVLSPRGWVRNGDLKVGDEICTPLKGVQISSPTFKSPFLTQPLGVNTRELNGLAFPPATMPP